MTTTRLTRSLLALWIATAASACSVLAPRPDPSRFYVLTALAEPSATERADAAQRGIGSLQVGVGPIAFPDYLETARMQTRMGNNRVEFSDIDRWAEPLSQGFRRALTEDLKRLLVNAIVVEYPWSPNLPVAYQVKIDLLRLERTDKGEAELVARWGVFDPKTGAVLYGEESTVNRSAAGPDTDSAVHALSEVIAELSHQIASAIDAQAAKDAARAASAPAAPGKR